VSSADGDTGAGRPVEESTVFDPGSGERGGRRPVAAWRELVRVRSAALRAEVCALAPAGRLDRCTAAHLDAMIGAAERTAAQRTGLRQWWGGAHLQRAWLSLHEAEVTVTSVRPVRRERVLDLLTWARSQLPGDDPLLAAGQELLGRLTAASRADAATAGTAGTTAVAVAVAVDPGGAGQGEPGPGGAEPGDPDTRGAGPGRVAADPDAADRRLLAELTRAAYAVSDERYARSHGFRNQLVRATGLGWFSVVLLVAAGLQWPAALLTCGTGGTGPDGVPVPGCPTGRAPGGPDLLLVMLFGAVGAYFSAVPALRRTGGSWNPFNLPLWQSMVKIPSGALTAFVGLFLLQNAGLSALRVPNTPGGVLTVALLFGIAQQAATRLIDRQAEHLLAGAPSAEERRQLGAAHTPAAPPG
jgi:hypothetical protein